jgi:hypothetical protein
MTTPTYSRRAGRLLSLDHGVKHSESWRDQQADDDRLDAARGIITAIALGAALWGALAGLAWWALGLLSA